VEAAAVQGHAQRRGKGHVALDALIFEDSASFCTR
jgi:hypothetical protein